MSLADRKKIYYELNTKLLYLDNNNLNKLLSKATITPKGLGSLTLLEIGTHKIFCKQTKITKTEYKNQLNTANLFNLPTYYNYGIGSEGINCYRELLMHIKTTNWVLDDVITNFPLMYHYRIMKNPNIKNTKPKKNSDYFDEKIVYWNSKEVGNYLKEKVESSYSILFFMEYIPLTAEDWLGCDYDRNKLYLKEINKIIKFLNKYGIIHFDMHPGNILINQNSDKNVEFYLTDFGLVYDPEFQTNDNIENNFYKTNINFDYVDILSNGLLNRIKHRLCYNQKFAHKYNYDKNGYTYDKIKFIYEHINDIMLEFDIDINFINLIKKYQHIIMIHETFIYNLKINPKKDDTMVYPFVEIESALKKLNKKL